MDSSAGSLVDAAVCQSRTMTEPAPSPVPLPRAIGAPATRALAAAGVTTLDDLRGTDLDELLRLHGVGPRAVRILREALATG